jgi:hypothetical protein
MPEENKKIVLIVSKDAKRIESLKQHFATMKGVEVDVRVFGDIKSLQEGFADLIAGQKLNDISMMIADYQLSPGINTDHAIQEIKAMRKDIPVYMFNNFQTGAKKPAGVTTMVLPNGVGMSTLLERATNTMQTALSASR